jgi:tetratricopeptide (TPR) repeat protein
MLHSCTQSDAIQRPRSQKSERVSPSCHAIVTETGLPAPTDWLVNRKALFILLAGAAARGNSIQLLGRAYIQRRDIDGFERALAESERLVEEINPEESSTNGLYCLGTVYEEYGRSYGTLGQMPKALDYLNKAEKELLPSTRWEILLMTSRAVTLVRGGEYKAGGELAIESAQMCRAHGNIRCLERVYGIQRYLERLSREMARISGEIQGSLDGPLGSWEVPTQG